MISIDGEKLADIVLENVKKEIEKKQLKLKLSVVLVGENLVSKSYIAKKKEACEAVGIEIDLISLPSDIRESELKQRVEELAKDESVSGIVIQLPLPKNLNTTEILNLVPVEKDPDVLSENSVKLFVENKLNILPPVVSAIKKIFEKYNIEFKNKKIVVIGKGKLVGKPLSIWLLNEGASFETLDKNTEDISSYTKDADIVISGAGSPELIKENMVKDGAILIDAGTSSEDGKVKGDIAVNACKRAGCVSPVPGGVGPMTVACLIENLVRLSSDLDK